MLLSARILVDVQSVNSYRIADQLAMTQGDTVMVYFQLIDKALDRPMEGFSPAGRRYIAVSGATLSVTFDSIDSAKKVVRSATQPFAGDKSIWSVSVLSTDLVRGTVPMKLSLVESGVTRTGIVQDALAVTATDGV